MTDSDSANSLGERNYTPFADRYAAAVETKPHNAYLERPATLSLLPPVRNKRVLDAGCGPGHNSEWLLEQGALVKSVDVTPRFVEIARRRLGNRVDVRQADLNEPLEFPDGSFDLVLCSLVFDYIPDLSKPLGEFYRLLAQSGILVFSMGHPTNDVRLFPDRDYFSTELKAWTWTGFGEPNPVVEWYCRPLSEILNPLAETGFRFDKILEMQPTKEYRAADPEEYERLMRKPSFLCIRAVKG
ncbi:MAG: methyltransferase domain-containing protein [Candidatus Eisenbacteria bacterium]|uniref:Methyltransferase domain-containing protein n=1 Tax=Eiseniibacteriota bacterium TaxID=2212470 RepID=A0A948WED4_UNCEI|nr:methyltransferase domain-containing protein [Candidatus Eisenbacteria bacterium]MBU1948129.1 methyltransferase domain-containing protein [Candidatus Eisenbacteria bacterium]MBU2692663.1 methyltransferase domain-containing protein [Candidatus Eisenbacteria bacterium]